MIEGPNISDFFSIFFLFKVFIFPIHAQFHAEITNVAIFNIFGIQNINYDTSTQNSHKHCYFCKCYGRLWFYYNISVLNIVHIVIILHASVSLTNLHLGWRLEERCSGSETRNESCQTYVTEDTPKNKITE